MLIKFLGLPTLTADLNATLWILFLSIKSLKSSIGIPFVNVLVKGKEEDLI